MSDGRGTEAGPRTGTGTPSRSHATRAAILEAARGQFAARGYERTTIRSVAAEATIDAALVMRHFGSKEQLFDAAAAVDTRPPSLDGVPREDVPRVLLRHFLELWEGADRYDVLLVVFRSAVTNEHAAARAREIVATQLTPALTALTDARRLGLLCAQFIGLATARYVLRVPSAVALTPDEIVELYAPAVRALLD
ncbi:TetR family transcriptional regulator [Streptomyces sp. NEAU-Y11]|uniref:TetR/AcrR family transcriptional regulator n=1 Tax=Streptomyces cucumeris TaxID=2962890 RepID=UPI0020C8DC9F|nr:TetR family transcriptional regulator [Streptomyces sp. NEAU-Y11]MCP9211920.1 TetR family transcriptional regulator [Streptomyces sp. NEAU-Y11]